jgi:hypothetical protein
MTDNPAKHGQQTEGLIAPAFQSPFYKIGPNHDRGRRPRGSVKKRNIVRSKEAKPYEAALAYAVANAEALGLADRRGLLFITVAWCKTEFAQLGHHDPDYSQEVEQTLNLCRRWYRRHGIAFHPFWRRELSSSLGEHFHELLPCPQHLQAEFRHYFKTNVVMQQPRSGGVQIVRPPNLQACEGCGRPMNWQHLVGCYFLKGSTAPVRDRRGINPGQAPGLSPLRKRSKAIKGLCCSTRQSGGLKVRGSR